VKKQMLFKRMLVALDGTPVSESVLAPAAILAKRCGAEVVLVRTVLEPAAASVAHQPLSPTAMLDVQAYLGTLASCLRGEGLSVQTALPLRSPTEGVLEQAEVLQVDVIVMATHGRSGLHALVHPSVTWQVLTRSLVPVLVWRDIQAGNAAAHPYVSHRFMTDATAPILVPLDGSLQAERALPVAQELARLFGNPLLLIRAAEPPFLAGSPVNYPQIRAEMRTWAQEEAESYLKHTCLAVASAGLRAESKSTLGPADEFILHCVREDHAGLVVMASHGRGWLGQVVLGSVAKSVLSQVDAPVLLVPRKAAQPDGEQPASQGDEPK
jgi:nucleotide-binding universal stress UspA family protein